MLGAIVGDVIGSLLEGFPVKTKDFPLFLPGSTFTDDTVLTVAVADWILSGRDLVDLLHEYFASYPDRAYGGRFYAWASTRDRRPYNSFGNGAAMRVSPVGFAFAAVDEVLDWAARSAAVTHDHPEGIRGAQATATAIHYARQRRDKVWIRTQLESQFGYDLGRGLDAIRPTYAFDVTCQGSVPEAIIAFLESTDYLDAIRNAVSLGGDTDTQACIAGGIAEAYYGGVPDEVAEHVMGLLDPPLAAVVEEFRHRFGLDGSPTVR